MRGSLTGFCDLCEALVCLGSREQSHSICLPQPPGRRPAPVRLRSPLQWEDAEWKDIQSCRWDVCWTGYPKLNVMVPRITSDLGQKRRQTPFFLLQMHVSKSGARLSVKSSSRLTLTFTLSNLTDPSPFLLRPPGPAPFPMVSAVTAPLPPQAPGPLLPWAVLSTL